MILKKIDNAKYTEKDLVPVVVKLNDALDVIDYTANNKNKKLQSSLFVGVGGGYSNIIIGGKQSIFENTEFPGAFVPFVTAGIDISSSRNLQAIVLRGELSFSIATYKGKGWKYSTTGPSGTKYPTTYTAAQKNLFPTASLLYSFVRKESFRVYAGVGAACNISFYNKNEYTQDHPILGLTRKEDYLSFPRLWVVPVFKLGARINKKLSAEEDGRLMSSMTDYSYWSMTPQTYTAQVRYYFQ